MDTKVIYIIYIIGILCTYLFLFKDRKEEEYEQSLFKRDVPKDIS